MKFQAHGGIDHVNDSASTSPGALATLVTATLAASAASRAPLDMRGAEATAEILPPRTRAPGRARGAALSAAGPPAQITPVARSAAE